MRTIILAFALMMTLVATPALAQAAATLTWTDNATDETAQEIERAPGTCAAPGTFAVVASVAANVQTYVDTTVTQGATYCYRLRALRNTTYSAYSNLAQFSPPAAPSGLTAQ